jgi:hypothetical protein
MSIGKRTYKLEDWPLHREGLFLSLLTFGLFIGIDILDRGFIIDVWTNISYSSITISNLIKTMSGIDPLLLTSLFVTMIIVFKNRKTLMNLDNKHS